MNKNNKIVMIGSGCMDEYYELEYVPVMGEKTVCRPLESKVGGMIGNAAAVAASYGMDTFLMDTINKSASSIQVLEDFKSQKVNLELVRYDENLPDVKCLIFLKDGERMIYVIPTQKKNLLLDDAQKEILKDAAYIYSTTRELCCFRQPLKVMNWFQKNGSRIVLDIEYLNPHMAETEWEMIQKADIVFVNAEGDRQLSSFLSPDYGQILGQKGCMVIKTRGEKGCVIDTPETKPIKIPAYHVSVADTTGAGDTFNSSFIFGLSQGWAVEEAGRFASAAAARAIQFLGARSGAEGVEKVKEFIDAYKEELR